MNVRDRAPTDKSAGASATRPRLHRNVWAASGASLLNDFAGEMIVNVLPLFLAGTLGLRASAIGLIEGVAQATAALVKIAAGRLSDRAQRRKTLAVGGYAISTVARLFFVGASSPVAIALVRWAERIGKGVRTPARDALLADSVEPETRGVAFGLHKAADTAGAVLGIGAAMLVVHLVQGDAAALGRATFEALVWLSAIPASLAVLVLALGAEEVPRRADSDGASNARDGASPGQRPAAGDGVLGLGRGFGWVIAIVSLALLGTPGESILILRTAERGSGPLTVLTILLAYNVVYAIVSVPAGRLVDQIGPRRVLVLGWLVNAGAQAGFALASDVVTAAIAWLAFGIHMGIVGGATKALVAELVPARLRATAYGILAAAMGLASFGASALAGLLWDGALGWPGLGPAAPFLLSSALALTAAVGALVTPPSR